MVSKPTWKSELWRSFMILVIGLGGLFLVGYQLSRLLPNELDQITAMLTTSQVLSRLLSPLGLILLVGAMALNSYRRIKKAAEPLAEPYMAKESQIKREKERRFAINGFQRLVLFYMLSIVLIFVWVPWKVDVLLPVFTASGSWAGRSGQQFAGYAFIWSKPSIEQIATHSFGGSLIWDQRVVTNPAVDIQRMAVEFLALSATFALALLIRKWFFKIRPTVRADLP